MAYSALRTLAPGGFYKTYITYITSSTSFFSVACEQWRFSVSASRSSPRYIPESVCRCVSVSLSITKPLPAWLNRPVGRPSLLSLDPSPRASTRRLTRPRTLQRKGVQRPSCSRLELLRRPKLRRYPAFQRSAAGRAARELKRVPPGGRANLQGSFRALLRRRWSPARPQWD
jgi:hypothetical protein